MSRSDLRPGLLQIGVILLFPICLYLIVSKGIGAYYGNSNVIDEALIAIDWDPSHAKAQFNSSRSPQIANQQPHLEKSIASNPADSRAILALASLLDQQKASRLMEHVAQLRPADGDVLVKAAAYWHDLGEVEKAFQLWNKALTMTKDYDKDLFPFFLYSLQQPSTGKVFLSLLPGAGKWWQRFFRFLSRQPDSLPLLEYLFQARSALANTVALNEYKMFVGQLIQAGETDKAYIYWLNSLDERARQGLGLLYDGSFEQQVENYGFGWHMNSSSAVVKTAYTVGAKGRKSLHVVFQGKSKPFHHVWQRLRLQPGKYRLNALARTVSLRTVRGLVWRVECRGKVMGKSLPFEGNTPWERFQFAFEIPEGCQLPVLRLAVEGRNPVEYRTRGEAWFDQLEIKRI